MEIDYRSIKDLWVNVIIRAVTDALMNVDVEDKYAYMWQKDARTWLGLEEETFMHSENHAHSFEWICETFDLPACKIRNACKGAIKRGQIINRRSYLTLENLFGGKKDEGTNCNKGVEDEKTLSGCGYGGGKKKEMGIDSTAGKEKEDFGCDCNNFDIRCA